LRYLRCFISSLNSDRCPEKVFDHANHIIALLALNAVNQAALVAEIARTTEQLGAAVETQLRRFVANFRAAAAATAASAMADAENLAVAAQASSSLSSASSAPASDEGNNTASASCIDECLYL
jgi:hypothetical protein